VRKTFASVAEARAWRQETQVALRRGTLLAPTRITLAEAAEAWLAAARVGLVRTRSGERYKPSALRSYERALATSVLPRLGRLRLSAVTRNDVQDLVDGLVAAGLAPSTVRNAVLPLRAIFRRALGRSEVAVNPTLKLALPAVRAGRERVARPGEAEALIAAVAPLERALWATAFYAGLRRGELRALGWGDVDLEGRLLRVERSWDRVAGAVEPKSRAGRRRVPVSRSSAATCWRTACCRDGAGWGSFSAGGSSRLSRQRRWSAPARRGGRPAWLRLACTSAAMPTPPS
jgi:integrase